MDSHHQLGLLIATVFLFNAAVTPTGAIGVNYGMLGDNLPPPTKVVEFLKTKTIIDRVRIFDANPDVLRAFANSGILVSITTPNGDIPALAQPGNAQQWVSTNVAPFAATIDRILIGTEVLHWGPQNIIDNLLPSMREMRKALDQAGFQRIQVSTPHSLGIMAPFSSWPASGGRFLPKWEQTYLAPILQFHRETGSPFIVNPYPYFGSSATNFKFCTFQEPNPWIDQNTKLPYFNMFDVELDAVYSAMKAVGFPDVDIVVGETGWPSLAEPFQTWVNPQTAQAYNGGVVRHVIYGRGTPLMPTRKIQVYIFALFQENQKPGPFVAERNFGLFNPDFTPVYNAGVVRGVPGPLPVPRPGLNPMPLPGPKPMPIPGQNPMPILGKKWCVPKRFTTPQQLQSALDFVCSQGLNCQPIQPNGPCFNPNTVRSHAAFAMNTWFQVKGPQPMNCDFSGIGKITNRDPSYPGCRFT